MVSGSAIREKLAAFFARQIDLDEFEDWLVQSTWNVHQSGDESARELAHAIELRLAEHSAGHLTGEALRRELLPFLRGFQTL